MKASHTRVGFTVQVTDSTGITWRVGSYRGLYFSKNLNGSFEAKFDVLRNIDFSFDKIALNCMCQITLPGVGKTRTVWTGRINAIEFKRIPRGDRWGFDEVMSVGAEGFWATLNNQVFYGSLQTMDPEGQLIQLYTQGYMPYLTGYGPFDSSGQGSQEYQTENGGSDSAFVADVIRGILKIGRVDGARLVAQVYNRTLTTMAIPSTPTVRYQCTLNMIKDMGLKRSLPDITTEVMVIYKDSTTGIQTSAIAANTSLENQLAVDYTGSGTKIPFKNVRRLNWSGLKNGTSAAAAQNYANQQLGQAAKLRTEADSIPLKPGRNLLDLTTGSRVHPGLVLPGYAIQIVDLYPRINEQVKAGTLAGDLVYNDTFLITEVRYTEDTDELVLIPEINSQLADIVA